VCPRNVLRVQKLFPFFVSGLSSLRSIKYQEQYDILDNGGIVIAIERSEFSNEGHDVRAQVLRS